jgi:hypothetical protein
MTDYTRLAAYLSLLIVACVSASVMAEPLYKSTDSNGRVIYSDKPVPGAVEIEGVRSAPIDPENAARIEKENKDLRRQEEEFQQRERERERASDEAQAEVIAALDALKVAQRLREAGVEPLPGERMGKVGGGSSFAPSYFERLQALDGDVNAAQQRLEQAYARRNEVR